MSGTPAGPRTGLVGLGRMGLPIVRRLIAAGHHPAVHDIDAAAVAQAASVAPGSAAAVAAASDILFVCVPGPAEVSAVLREAFEAMRPGSTVVEMSTVSPTLGRDFAAAAAARGIGFIDGPLSGGVDSAIAGTLVMMAGGEARALDVVRPVIACFASDLFHLGPAGSGYLAKAINQAIYLSYAASFCEAAALGATSGLNVPVLLDVLRRSVAGKPLMTHWEERIASEDLAPGFQVARVLKDLAMAEAACADAGFDAKILKSVVSAFRGAADSGHGGHDMTALYQMKRAGTEAR